MDLPVLPGPSLAELAQTAVASAATAVVTAVGRGCGFPAVAVTMRAGPAGQPVLVPAAGSALARLLATGPDVRIRVPARPPFAALELAGRVLGGAPGPAVYDLLLESVTFTGAVSAPVPLGQYLAAEPDPLWRHAPGVLQHLERGHATELMACIRRHGIRPAEWVAPVGLDRFGLRLLVVTADGITDARLSFPDGPVTSFAQVPTSLRTVLACRCQASRLRPGGPAAGGPAAGA